MATKEWQQAHQEDLKRYRREWYRRNRESSIKRSRENSKRGRVEAALWLQEYKGGLDFRCQKCGEGHPATLCFHHRDPKEKEAMVSGMARLGWSKKRMLRELEKCDVLCRNCHAKVHWDWDHQVTGGSSSG